MPTRDASADDWRDYLTNASRMIESARDLLNHADGDDRAQSAAMLAVHAAIAFGDAVTISKLGQRNTKNHAELPALVERAAGRSTDPKQIARLRRILRLKDSADYGAQQWRHGAADDLVKDVERFSAWVRDLLL